MSRTLFLALAGGALLSLPASAQIASGLVREGDAPAGAPPGHTVSSITDPAVNKATGYAVGLSTSDGVTTLSHFWGEPTLSGAPAVIRTEATIGNLVQNSFESFWGYSDAGQTAYSPLCENTSTGGTSLDCVFLDGTVLCEEDQPIASLPGKLWRFGSRPGVSADGIPYWIGGIDDATTGANEGRGLFLGASGTVIMKSGDVLPGTGGPLDGGGISFDYRFSARTTHYLVEVDTTESTSIDAYMILDGQVLTAGGPTDQVREGDPVPASIGGLPGENWDNFDYCGITEAGDWFFSGDTEPSTADDEILVKNGVILYREGQTLDGEVLTGTIDDAYMNEAGDIAFVWNVVDATLGDPEALFLNDDLLVREGDAVDLDGDGVVEPTSLLVGFTDVVLGEDGEVYFVGTVDVNGTSTTSDDIEGLFRVECKPTPYGIGKLNSAGQRSHLGWSGQPSLAAGNFALQTERLSPGNLGLAFWGPQPAQIPLFNHFLYVGSPVTRILPPVASSASGSASVPIPITPAMVGTTRYYQYWQRDPLASDGTGVELSNGLEVPFCN
jgi:hypothetical protein